MSPGEQAVEALRGLLRAVQRRGASSLPPPREVQRGLVALLLGLVFVDEARARGLRPPAEGAAVFGSSHWLDGLLEPDDIALASERLDGVQGGAGGVYERLLDFEVRRASTSMELLPGQDRRRAGAHYTPRELVRRVVESTLGPLLAEAPSGEGLPGLVVCDPAMGAGAFLVESCRWLGERLARAWGQGDDAERRARALVATRCLRGVDLDPMAVLLARRALWIEVGDDALPLDFADATLRQGDALLGLIQQRGALVWQRDFAEVFARQPAGFDAFVGNPPWVSYAGRAAQPLSPERRALYRMHFESFRGYRNLQGLFVELCARLLRPGGRVGLVLPSSMAELAGYEPVRAAHDRLCLCDPDLPDLGEDSFEGVFQPCMLLLSTRASASTKPRSGANGEHARAGAGSRAAGAARNTHRVWGVGRGDLDGGARRLMEKMGGEALPAWLFGERGVQTRRGDGGHLQPRPDEVHTVPLRGGGDVGAFALGAPSFYANAGWFAERLRSSAEWARVRVVLRQTARVPTAALSDGVAFRNSLLAGFEDADHPAEFLVAYLNSTPLRWLHYARHRDARQGMPQLKISHLRSLPAPPARWLVARLAELGRALSTRNTGASWDEQQQVDRAVGQAFGLDEAELTRLWTWARPLRGLIAAQPLAGRACCSASPPRAAGAASAAEPTASMFGPGPDQTERPGRNPASTKPRSGAKGEHVWA